MGLLARIGRALTRAVERVTGLTPARRGRESERATPEFEDYEPRERMYDAPRAETSELPPGWVLVGLYKQGEKTQRIHATDASDVTDSEIHSADALIVWYEAAGSDGYRWVHGATGWRSLADQVERTIIIVSPTGRGE